jgi:hypothetical protein
MMIEILVDGKGIILALGAARERHGLVRPNQGSGEPDTRLPPTIELRPRAGQFRYVLALPADLEAMPLKEIHRSFRIAGDPGSPQLKRVVRKARSR